jgi:hypothetical protein
MRHLFFLAVSFVAVSAFGGSTPDGPIWSWTPAERVAVRSGHYGPPRGGPHVESLSVGSGDRRFFIDGQTSPELFMPMELFNALLQGLADDGQMRAVNRQILAPGIRAFGFEEEAFWAKVDQATAAFRDQVRARSRRDWSKTRAELSQQRAPTESDLKLCKARAATLESLRSLFRTEGFDRFLYTVVAPTITVTSEGAYENPDHLLSLERGCQ